MTIVDHIRCRPWAVAHTFYNGQTNNDGAVNMHGNRFNFIFRNPRL